MIFIFPKPGSAPMRLREVGRVGGLGPDALGIAAVLVHDDLAELLHPLRHRAREAMDRRTLAERVLERLRVHGCDRARVERPDPLLEAERPGERLLHRHLLIDREPDQQRERVTGDQRVRLVRVREVQRLGHGFDSRLSVCASCGSSTMASPSSAATHLQATRRSSRSTARVRGRERVFCTSTSTAFCLRPASASSPSTAVARASRRATRPAAASTTQARDALAVLGAVGVERLGLWGYSQGGWVAPLAATMSDRVAFLVLVASTGVTPSEQMRYANAAQLRLAGFGEDDVTRALELRRRFEDHVHGIGRDHEDELRADLRAALDEEWFGTLFIPPVPLDEEGCALWIEEMDFDPRPVFAEVTVPTLAFFGAADSWTPVEPSVEAWRRRGATRSRSSSSATPSTS